MKLNTLREVLKQKRDESSEQIFNEINQVKDLHTFIDLHGQNQSYAVKIAKKRVLETKDALLNGEIKPNSGIIENQQNHVLKFICGAGKHCKNGVLKHLIFKVLKEELGYEAYMNEEKGNVLVRLKVKRREFI